MNSAMWSGSSCLILMPKAMASWLDRDFASPNLHQPFTMMQVG